eukprot:scaffold328_cov130-Cylindrotheca_fusiformis.AAC.28
MLLQQQKFALSNECPQSDSKDNGEDISSGENVRRMKDFREHYWMEHSRSNCFCSRPFWAKVELSLDAIGWLKDQHNGKSIVSKDGGVPSTLLEATRNW